jgi:hypothetical protein
LDIDYPSSSLALFVGFLTNNIETNENQIYNKAAYQKEFSN